MKWFNKILLTLAEWLQPPYKAKYVNDPPEVFNKRTVYIVGEQSNPWLLTFECPCSCKSTIQLNLLKEAKPRWKFQVLPKSKIDIFPSISRIYGCKSHFFMRKGKISWCKNEEGFELF